MDPNLVILAGGKSTRMRRDTSTIIDASLKADAETRSKSMIRLGEGGRPFLDYLLYNAREAGYRDIVIVAPEGESLIREQYGRAGFPGLDISFAFQPTPPGRAKPLGTADALERTLRLRTDWETGKVTVCNSDNLYSQRALRLMLNCAYRNGLIDYDRSCLSFDQPRIEQFALLRKDSEGFLLEIVEKPTAKQVAEAGTEGGRIGVSMNIFRLTVADILPYLETLPLHPGREEKELPLAVRALAIDQPRSVFAFPLAEHVPDLTHQEDMAAMQEFLKKEFPNFAP